MVKYERLLEFMKDPVYYQKYRESKLKFQRKYAEDPEYRKKRALSTADWRLRKALGMPTRPRVNRKPQVPLLPPSSPRNFDFSLVPEVSVSFD